MRIHLTEPNMTMRSSCNSYMIAVKIFKRNAISYHHQHRTARRLPLCSLWQPRGFCRYWQSLCCWCSWGTGEGACVAASNDCEARAQCRPPVMQRKSGECPIRTTLPKYNNPSSATSPARVPRAHLPEDPGSSFGLGEQVLEPHGFGGR